MSEEIEDQVSGDDTPTLDTLDTVEVPFLDALIMALLGNDGDIYVPVVPFCNHLGLASPYSQIARIKRDDTMIEGLRKMPIATSGGTQATQSIRLDMFTIWLIGISEKMCKEEIRLTLSRYKREAARAILAHFRQKALIRVTAATPMPLPETSAPPSEWANYHRAMAVMYDELERQRSVLVQQQQQLDRHDDEIVSIRDDLTGVKETLAIIGEITKDQRISPHQASEIQQLVGMIHDHSGLHQKTIYGAFNKQWKIPRYDELPTQQFDTALEWLKQWGRAKIKKTT